MSKTLTTFEALKANETKRVRAEGALDWWNVRELIKALDGGLFPSREGVRWEAEESMRECFLLLEKGEDGFKTYEDAEQERLQMTYPNDWKIVRVREVRP